MRAEDRLGNMEADSAADLGRGHQREVVVGARRVITNAKDLWYPSMLQLHRFMVAIPRVAVNHDGQGGTAPDSRCLGTGSGVKQRKVEARGHEDLATLPGPPGFLCGPWILVNSGCITVGSPWSFLPLCFSLAC